MKLHIYLLIACCVLWCSHLAAQNPTLNCPNTDPTITSWVISDGVTTTRYYDDIADETSCNPTIVNSGIEANVQAVYYDMDYVWVEATGCPDYLCGPFNGDGNPSFPSNQNRIIVIPRTPTPNPGSSANSYNNLGAMGYLINGVAIFNAGDGMSYNNQGVWNRNAIVMENEGFGCDRSHPAMGNLHNHQIPMGFNYSVAGTQSDICDCFPSDGLFTAAPAQHSPLIGFAADGYPIYGPYAYANVDGTGGIALMTPSYQVRNITARTHYADGTNVTDGPAISAAWPLGAFYEDYEFIANSGTLDYYNGRFAITPEYPCGTYAYYTTMEANGNALFPYVVGLEFYGEVLNCDGGTGGGGPPVVDCDAFPPPPAGAPCCGDGICNGSEDATTCPDDCGGVGGVDCTPSATATLYAQSGNTPTCTSTVSAGDGLALSCDTGTATLTGSGRPDTGVTGGRTFEWCTYDGNIISGGTTLNAVVDAPGTYVLYITNTNGYSAWDIVEVREACSIALSVKVILQGAYDSGSGMMDTNLRTANLLPNTDPYSATETATNSMLYSGTAGDMIVDWVLLELRDTTNPAVVAASQPALLQADGDIISANGKLVVDMVAPAAGDYHIVVRHRNHLGVMSNNTITIN